ncbi:hypothetical protein HID58_000914 [Brassica napus]|uniref:Uncharacterized protein n=1 Tax=Brassica napus TaxID=3708 RepID=A0ABQ8EHX0_BRANA|nr:hypothetical protein HID58_000914 [Brassica napus]
MMDVALASSKACYSISYTFTPFSRSNSVLACSGSNPDQRRRTVIFGSSLALASSLLASNQQSFPVESAIALEQLKEEELEEEEERNVNLFQVF